MAVDPRSLDAVVQRVMFIRLRRCSARVIVSNRHLDTGAAWIGPESCGEIAIYATVRKGRVSPRCDRHAREDAKALNVSIRENPMMEVTAGKASAPPKQAKGRQPDPSNPLNGIHCLTHAAARLFRGTP